MLNVLNCAHLLTPEDLPIIRKLATASEDYIYRWRIWHDPDDWDGSYDERDVDPDYGCDEEATCIEFEAGDWRIWTTRDEEHGRGRRPEGEGKTFREAAAAWLKQHFKINRPPRRFVLKRAPKPILSDEDLPF